MTVLEKFRTLFSFPPTSNDESNDETGADLECPPVRTDRASTILPPPMPGMPDTSLSASSVDVLSVASCAALEFCDRLLARHITFPFPVVRLLDEEYGTDRELTNKEIAQAWDDMSAFKLSWRTPDSSRLDVEFRRDGMCVWSYVKSGAVPQTYRGATNDGRRLSQRFWECADEVRASASADMLEHDREVLVSCFRYLCGDYDA